MSRELTIQDEFGTLVVREVLGSPDVIHIHLDDTIRDTEASMLLNREDSLRLRDFLDRILK